MAFGKALHADSESGVWAMRAEGICARVAGSLSPRHRAGL
jgi:hypothetical protein